ncbi:MAG: CHAD domain-containing protein [Burkholderiaceae bacterium]|nr:CHAD domain-containing protein [Burkholderiaceae bacterium]
MNEIELCLTVTPQARDAVKALMDARSGTGARPRRKRLQALYFDTRDQALARAGMALRLRSEGGRWVQTLKGQAADGMTRLEHEVPLPALRGRAMPALDPARHQGSELGERLLALLQAAPGAPLEPLLHADIWRLARQVQAGEGVLELALDEGFVWAQRSGPAQRLAVCELEVELQKGAPRDVIDEAGRWLAQGLWLEWRNKAQRAAMLARGQTAIDSATAGKTGLSAGMSVQAARRAMLQSCLDQIGANAGQIAAGLYHAEHVHQLRVGLRRLRSGLRLFEGLLPGEPDDAVLVQRIQAESAALFRALGVIRDDDVQTQGWGPILAQVWAQRLTARDGSAGAAAAADQAPVASAGPATPLLRQHSAQALLLDMMRLLHAAEPPAGAPARLSAALKKRLRRWHAQVCGDATAFASLDEEARHKLRKRLKRLRYGLQFSAGLFDPLRLKRGLAPIAAAQDLLGEFNDLAVALAERADRVSTGPDAVRSAFEWGYLLAQRERLLARAAPVMAALGQSKVPWKG